MKDTYKLSDDGSDILWVSNPGNIYVYMLDKNIDVIAPEGYKIIIKSVKKDGQIKQYDTNKTEIDDLHKTLLSLKHNSNFKDLFYFKQDSQDWFSKEIDFYFHAIKKETTTKTTETKETKDIITFDFSEWTEDDFSFDTVDKDDERNGKFNASLNFSSIPIFDYFVKEKENALVLTNAMSSQKGVVRIYNLKNIDSILNWEINFKLYMGDSRSLSGPADGLSLNLLKLNDDENYKLWSYLEKGVGDGISISFNMNFPNIPAIEILYNSTSTKRLKWRSKKMTNLSNSKWVEVNVKVDNGYFILNYKNMNIFNELLPEDWPTISDPEFIFCARTGILNQKHEIKDVVISVPK